MGAAASAKVLSFSQGSTRTARSLPSAESTWSLSGLSGRLVELSGAAGSAALTIAVGLVHQAQMASELTAWVTPWNEHGGSGTFFPPDAAAAGVDLRSLAVVRVPGTVEAARAADHLARAGAFGLIVVDVGAARVSAAAQSRLLGLVQKHHTALLFLTRKRAENPSLGSLVSLRATAHWQRTEEDRFRCSLQVVKDKRRPPGWRHEEVCCGPPGLH